MPLLHDLALPTNPFWKVTCGQCLPETADSLTYLSHGLCRVCVACVQRMHKYDTIMDVLTIMSKGMMRKAAFFHPNGILLLSVCLQPRVKKITNREIDKQTSKHWQTIAFVKFSQMSEFHELSSWFYCRFSDHLLVKYFQVNWSGK